MRVLIWVAFGPVLPNSEAQIAPAMMSAMENFQLARDASMASAITASMADKDRVVLVAGGFQTRKDLGVPLHLQAQLPKTKPLIILLIEVEEGAERLSDYPDTTAEIADYV